MKEAMLKKIGRGKKKEKVDGGLMKTDDDKK
jgi:hypothetical protein